MKGLLKFYINTVKVSMPVYTAIFMIRETNRLPRKYSHVCFDLAKDLTKIAFFPVTMPIEMAQLYWEIRRVGKSYC